MQEASLDLKSMATKDKLVFTPEPKLESRKQKRKENEDEAASQPRPRRLRFSPQQEATGSGDEPREGEGDEGVPTPTSSAEQEPTDDEEDTDIFQGSFAQKKGQASQTEQVQPRVQVTPETKPSKASDPGSNASMRSRDYDQDVKDIMATMEDALLATLPAGFSRRDCVT